MTDNIKFIFDDEATTTCIIKDKQGNSFFGKAICHPDDMDMMSRRTGQEIAYCRAELAALRFYRDNELTTAYKTLNHLYNNIQCSQHFNPHEYTTKMLKRQVDIAYEDLLAIKELIEDRKEALLDYLHQKNNFYEQVRRYRKVKQLEEEHNKN